MPCGDIELGSGNYLLPDGTKLLAEAMLIYHQCIQWHSLGGNFTRDIHQPLSSWKIAYLNFPSTIPEVKKLIEIWRSFSFMRTHFKLSSTKCRPSCPGAAEFGGSNANWGREQQLHEEYCMRSLGAWTSEVGVTKPSFPFRYFPDFSALWIHSLAIEYHVYIWQVSPQLSCGDTCQIWMWLKRI